MKKPSKLDDLMYGLMKGARRHSFMDFLENWGITEAEYEEIEEWFKQFEVKL